MPAEPPLGQSGPIAGRSPLVLCSYCWNLRTPDRALRPIPPSKRQPTRSPAQLPF
jgi:hypothetical protein